MKAHPRSRGPFVAIALVVGAIGCGVWAHRAGESWRLPAFLGVGPTVAVSLFMATRAIAGRWQSRRIGEGTEVLLDAVLDALPDSVLVLDDTQHLVRVNMQAELTFGQSRESLVGQPVASLIRDPKPHHESGFGRSAAGGAGVRAPDLVGSGLRNDGTELPVEIRVSAVASSGRSLTVWIVRDIAEQKRRQEDRDLFFTLSIDMLCIAGMDGYFLRINPAWEKTLGHSLDELRTEPYLSFVHPDDREATLREVERLASGSDTIAFENRYRCKDGSYKWILWNATPLVDQGLIYAVAHDVTARKKNEAAIQRTTEELTRSNAQLRKLADDLESMATSRQAAYQELQHAYHELKKTEGQLVQAEKMSSLGQMVAGVAHEINNPLAFVTNNLAVLRRDVGALRDVVQLYQRLTTGSPDHQASVRGELDELADRIDLTYVLESLDGLMDRTGHGVRRIQQIVKDLRNFARLDEADLHEVDLNEGVRSTVNIIVGQAKACRVEVQQDLGPLPAVTCYPGKINQVVLNLLTNAIDASPSGGTVVVRTRTVCDGVEIQVVDSGHGIDPAIQDRIFDPFFTTKPIGKGTGLGLSISYGIVQSHGGRIKLESSPGVGTSFTIWLPMMPVRSASLPTTITTARG